jgi:hypothetical protein
MYFDNEKSDESDEIIEFYKKLDESVDFHSKNLKSKSHEEVVRFIGVVTNSIIDLLDQIEDDQLAITLTQLVGATLGGMGQAILELREENEMLKHDILYKLQGDIDPELN